MLDICVLIKSQSIRNLVFSNSFSFPLDTKVGRLNIYKIRRDEQMCMYAGNDENNRGLTCLFEQGIIKGLIGNVIGNL